MLHSLVRNEGAHALMIYPMKALAFDQRNQIEQLCELLSIHSWPYDGDTPDDVKKVLREQPPQILLTNPEYLNMSFLGSRGSWNPEFLRNLRYVVIDEMHEYRGFFGGNMALLLRRFFLHLRSHWSEHHGCSCQRRLVPTRKSTPVNSPGVMSRSFPLETCCAQSDISRLLTPIFQTTNTGIFCGCALSKQR